MKNVGTCTCDVLFDILDSGPCDVEVSNCVEVAPRIIGIEVG